MKELQDILFGVELVEVKGQKHQSISEVYIDSRKVTPDSVFVAIPGVKLDGHEFIPQAVENGARVIVAEHLPSVIDEHVTYLVVKNARKALATIAANYYDHPSKKLKLVGVTGTNGKTTIVTLLHELFTRLGKKAGMLSTVENRIGQNHMPATLTTPDALTINRLLSEMVEQDVEFAFMEVSSHAIDQYRVNNLHFEGGVFTNLTHDHLDYHKSFKDYLEAKQKFFTMLPKTSFALYNEDDKNGPVMVQNSKARKISYGRKSFADYHVKILEESMEGLLVSIQSVEVYSPLIGSFNALNLLATFAVAIELGENREKVYEKLSLLTGPKGRFQRVISSNRIIGIVDYAHTPDSLEKTLEAIDHIRTKGETLITVVGCGGDRDRSKRPLMGEIAASKSDKAIFTSDNPRSEDPQTIINQMLEGVKITQRQKVLSIVNRREAIQTAVIMAQPNDIILLAGKGHEDYQEVNGQKFPFDDVTELKKAFEEFENQNVE